MFVGFVLATAGLVLFTRVGVHTRGFDSGLTITTYTRTT